MNLPKRRSIYLDTAPPGPELAAFSGTHTTEVAVVGGGIAGLSCALHLAERGTAVTLLEANEIGWGASGRNGGQVNPGLKLSPTELRTAFGSAVGDRLTAWAGAAPDLVFNLVARHGIACAPRRGGTLRAVKSASQAALAEILAADYAGHGAPVRYLDSADVASMTGTSHYLGALFDGRGGDLNPLAYTRGLARAAAAAGAGIHVASPVTALSRVEDAWRLTLPGGTVTARHVVLCANAYQTNLWPGLAQSQVPVYSMIVGTAPLPQALLTDVMPSGSVLYEQADVTVYLRVDDTGHLLMGGRSPSREIMATDCRHLQDYAVRLWPQLRGITWTHLWNGQLAVTTDNLPHLHEPAPGLIAILGCNGRGVALMTAIGERIAARIATGEEEAHVLPRRPIRPIPLHRFWRLGVTMRVAYGRAKDSFRA